jgi:tetratricopeptide (TPR) repeat protein
MAGRLEEKEILETGAIAEEGTGDTDTKFTPSSAKSKSLIEKLRSLFFFTITLIAIILCILLLIRVIQEIRKDPLIIQPVAVPSDLEKRGYSGKIITRMLADQMVIILNDVHRKERAGTSQRQVGRGERQREEPVPSRKARPKSTQVEDAEKKTPRDIILPGIGVPLNAIVALVRFLFQLEPTLVVNGYVTVAGETLSLTVGSNKILPRTFSDEVNDLDQIIRKAALHVLTIMEPLKMGLNFCFGSKKESLKSLISTLLDGTRSEKDRVVTLILEGCLLGKEKETNLAIEKFETALKIPLTISESEHSIAHRLTGDFLKEAGRYDEAITHYKKALEKEPDNSETYTRLAYAYLVQDKFNQAEEMYKKAIKREENDAWIYLAWGYALWDKDYYDKSIGKFTKAIDLASNPEISTWANLSWGEVLREQGHPNKGIEKFSRSIKLASTSEISAWAHGAWGDALLDLDEPEAAIAKYKNAVELAPMEAWPYGAWGDALRDLYKPEEAIAQYKKAIKLAPKKAWPYGAWGNVLRDLDKPEEARRSHRSVQKNCRTRPRGGLASSNPLLEGQLIW